MSPAKPVAASPTLAPSPPSSPSPAPPPEKSDPKIAFEDLPTLQEEAGQDIVPVTLTWRSWLTIAICALTVAAQVNFSVGCGVALAFIVRDLGSPGVAAWIVQAPLLVHSVIGPTIGRVADIYGQKWIVVILSLAALPGVMVMATADSMTVMIVGSVLVGLFLPTVSTTMTILVEVLPLKYRLVGAAFSFVGGASGSLIGNLGGGALINSGPTGYRSFLWMATGLIGLAGASFLLGYHPRTTAQQKTLRASQKALPWSTFLWQFDPIGTGLYMAGATLVLLALNWVGGTYAGRDAHVAAPLTIGLVVLAVFGAYEWKGRADGLVHHVLFRANSNFVYAMFMVFVEGWLYTSALSTITPQMILHLGWEDNAWSIGIRQLAYKLPNLAMCVPVVWYATRFRDLHTPLYVTWALMVVVSSLYTAMQLEWRNGQYGILVLCGIAQAGPLALMFGCVQYTSPHGYLTTATSLANSMRTLGGAVGTAVLSAIVNQRIQKHYAPAVSARAVAAGLPPSSLPALLKSMAAGRYGVGVEGATPQVWAAATQESRLQYLYAYRNAWASTIPFIVIAILCVWRMKPVKDLMTDKVEATVEKSASEKSASEEKV